MIVGGRVTPDIVALLVWWLKKTHLLVQEMVSDQVPEALKFVFRFTVNIYIVYIYLIIYVYIHVHKYMLHFGNCAGITWRHPQKVQKVVPSINWRKFWFLKLEHPLIYIYIHIHIICQIPTTTKAQSERGRYRRRVFGVTKVYNASRETLKYDDSICSYCNVSLVSSEIVTFGMMKCTKNKCMYIVYV